ncbi:MULTISPECIES: 30S ribosomal protein S6--L-glutamate ligase [Mesoflavibacter]|jgi:ribosomal protein S6--L-glutamate ligase|uniref:Probable alpha-L-glutamate ligase n=1 Tax=Mesoflavibacter zeaxanthinifaciens subsp. sabulilitoris TaxID=1520893 RepID=A0A2T1NI21_9FLAO|nr:MULTISPECIES: 30S ribosomal protein S6--L-glutamate ligase [Mesoflavibacter]MBB3124346.1 ribosomal protein S6--L-glutamate ligase [Mesoflavibacter zeaxanthinifaciens subsp. sabulilitoris]PSG92555.1 30S ribosomal protein S6--L-glutamate ligase [Mesoflavibacter zeaxanthinifaciens subsp. sabulilitoris]UAB76621.1 30S ribosomal protein S6--L-glutamate ligase [Mesoflavibacter sp. SCSIO 43206]
MNIVILSRNAGLYSTDRLVEEAENRGHKVEVIDPLKCDIIIEKEKPTIYYKDRYLDYVDAVIPRIGASVTFYGCAVVRQFEMMGVFTTVTSDSILRSRDKLKSLQRLSKRGIGMPKTVFTNYSRDVEEVIDHVGGAPVIIKLLEGTQGLGVVLAETKNAAESVLEAFNGLQARVIVQEFIKEAKGADLRALVVDGQVVGAMKRQGKEGEFRSNLHRGGSAKIIKLSEAELRLAMNASRALKLPVCGVDMLQSERGPLLLEVNSTPGLEGIEKATGKNIAKSIITYLERNSNA